MKQYEATADYELLRRVPLIIRVDGKNFSRLTRKMVKPFDPNMTECMVMTMQYMLNEIEGAVFAYQQSDEISIILRNDQSIDTEAWHANRLSKICSVAASLATLGFQKAIRAVSEPPMMVGDAIFDARAFPVPSLNEAMNYLIHRQQDCLRNSINLASQVHLSKKLGKKVAFDRLLGLKSSEKIELLFKECQVDFEDDLPSSYRLGVAIYRIPSITNNVVRNKWQIRWDTGKFLENKEHYYSILQNGHDLLRAENIISE